VRRDATEVALRNIHDAAQPGAAPAASFADMGEAAFRALTAPASQAAAALPLDAPPVRIHRLLLTSLPVLPVSASAASRLRRVGANRVCVKFVGADRSHPLSQAAKRQRSSHRLPRRRQRSAITALAPATVQRMPDCLRR